MRNINNIVEENKKREEIHIDNVFATKYQHMVIFVPFYLSLALMCVFFLQIYKIQKFMAIADILGWNFYTYLTKDHLSEREIKKTEGKWTSCVHPP